MLLDAELMKKTGVFALVSGELLAFIGGGYWLGKKIDSKLQTGVLFSSSLALLGLVYSVWRLHRLSKSWMRKTGE